VLPDALAPNINAFRFAPAAFQSILNHVRLFPVTTGGTSEYAAV
jgi:hypothetical protein